MKETWENLLMMDNVKTTIFISTNEISVVYCIKRKFGKRKRKLVG
jgi:hypothetical protein